MKTLKTKLPTFFQSTNSAIETPSMLINLNNTETIAFEIQNMFIRMIALTLLSDFYETEFKGSRVFFCI